MRRALLALAAAAALSGCDRGKEAPPPAPAPAPAPAPLAGPLTYEKKTPAAEVSLSLPERVGQIPALYAQLFAQRRNELDAFAEGAVEDVEARRAAGGPAEPLARQVDYTLSAETPRLLSLGVSIYENSGGAHPNGWMESLIWDKAAARPVTTADLFAPGADMSAADAALCDRLKAQKIERTGRAEFSGDFTDCPPLKETTVALAPSTTPGKAGGLVVAFSPYQVGPYVEGSYEIELPLTAFRSTLAPAWAGEFDGAPAPVPDKPAPPKE